MSSQMSSHENLPKLLTERCRWPDTESKIRWWGLCVNPE